MTTIEQLEIALKAIGAKGDKFAALMPDKVEFDYHEVGATVELFELVNQLTDELVPRGYRVNKWYDSSSGVHKFRATKIQ
jgi:hypothetical protein